MKPWMIDKLVRLAKWLGWTEPVTTRFIGPQLDPAVLDTAKKWILKYGEDRSTSGEYKRHQVYAQLIKSFPAEEKYRLALAIEWVIYTQREMV